MSDIIDVMRGMNTCVVCPTHLKYVMGSLEIEHGLTLSIKVTLFSHYH